MSEPITWTNDKRKLSDLTPWQRNPRQIREDEARRLAESLDEFGQIQTIAIGPDNEILDGHQRQLVWAASEKFGPDQVVDVRVASRPLTEKEREKQEKQALDQKLKEKEKKIPQDSETFHKCRYDLRWRSQTIAISFFAGPQDIGVVESWISLRRSRRVLPCQESGSRSARPPIHIVIYREPTFKA